MKQEDPKTRMIHYYQKSKPVYDIFLGHAKHLGFRSPNQKISEKQAINLMHDLIGKKLNLSASMRVLDAGCGEGIVSSYLCEKYGCRIEGVTIVPFEIKRAEKTAKKKGVAGKVRYSFMDFNALRFPDAYFDAVYSIESLVHSQNLRKTFAEFNRVLKKGAQAAFFEYCIAEENEFSSDQIAIRDQMIYVTGLEGLKQFRLKNISKLLDETGFQQIQIEDITENVAASVLRLKKYFVFPYQFIRLLNARRYFPNLTSIVEFSKMGQMGIFMYKIYLAKKRDD